MEISALPKDKKIILFDGICNLCDASVQFIVKHDKKDSFRFVALQSDLGKKIITYIGIDSTKIDSLILYEPGKAYYYKSQAVLRIATELGGIYHLIRLAAVIPKSILNSVYDYVANKRYQWFGKKESCMLPSAELHAKFLV